MTDNKSSNLDKIEKSSFELKLEQGEKNNKGLEIKTPEGLDFMEDIDTNISESSETKEGEKSSKAGKRKIKNIRKLTAAEIRAKLIASNPPAKLMKKEIKAKLNKEMNELAKKLNKIGDKIGHAFEINMLVARMRELTEILVTIASATYQVLKAIWLKVVHGIL